MHQPIVSVVIPTFERGRQLREAVESVLLQTLAEFELIVVDDGSVDGAYLDSFSDSRIIVIKHAVNRGAAAARNTGVSVARGRYVAFLDSDDVWRPEKLERQVVYLQSTGGSIRAACTGFQYVFPDGGSVDRTPDSLMVHDDLYRGCRCSPGSTLMVETSLFREVGGFNEDMRRLEDWDWLLRATERTDIGGLQDTLAIVKAPTSRRNLYSAVKGAAIALRGSWKIGHGRRSFAQHLVLRGTIRHELATFAYFDRKYLVAAGQMAMALCLAPNRAGEFVGRSSNRLIKDIAAAFRSR